MAIAFILFRKAMGAANKLDTEHTWGKHGDLIDTARHECCGFRLRT